MIEWRAIMRVCFADAICQPSDRAAADALASNDGPIARTAPTACGHSGSGGIGRLRTDLVPFPRHSAAPIPHL
jgi:hypothetical protein